MASLNSPTHEGNASISEDGPALRRETAYDLEGLGAGAGLI
ncbi:hypothetical protein [Bacillus sp. FJAT-27445]|nr:hypothetical protein [Bacillus sp. FJAT-27445]